VSNNLYLTLPFVVAVIVSDQGKVLIGQHPNLTRKPYPLLWDFPGGKVNPDDETVEEALRREVREETGMEIISVKLFGVFHHTQAKMLPNRAPVTVPSIALCYKVKGSGMLIPDEMLNMHWAALEEVRSRELTPWAGWVVTNFFPGILHW